MPRQCCGVAPHKISLAKNLIIQCSSQGLLAAAEVLLILTSSTRFRSGYIPIPVNGFNAITGLSLFLGHLQKPDTFESLRIGTHKLDNGFIKSRYPSYASSRYRHHFICPRTN